MKYKVGDKVRVHSLEWFKNNCKLTGFGYELNSETDTFVTEMFCFAGEEVIIKEFSHCDKGDFYFIKNSLWNFYDWMFEDAEMEEVLVPFDIDKAKSGAKVVTGDGKTARIICYDRCDKYQIVALIEDKIISTYSKKGEIIISQKCNQDLFIKEIRQKQQTEFTMQEIADKLGVNVEQLTIKK